MGSFPETYNDPKNHLKQSGKLKEWVEEKSKKAGEICYEKMRISTLSAPSSPLGL